MGTKVLLVLATIATAQPVNGLPFGGTYLFKVDDAAHITADTQQLFADTEVPDGDHVANCWALDTSGAPIGDPVTMNFTTPPVVVAPPAPVPPPPPATYLAPASLTVSFPS